MNISIFGLGYVGCVSLGCLAEKGHRVIGVDPDKTKVDFINDGKPTIMEKQIDDISFDVLEIQIIMGKNTIRQKHYATIMNGYVVLFGLTYTDDVGLEKLDKIINAIDFY